MTEPTAISEFTPEQLLLKDSYLKTFKKHKLSIDEFERQVCRFKKYRKYSGVPEDFLIDPDTGKVRAESFETMKSDPNQVRFINAIKDFIESDKRFLLISSEPSGNGKSRLAANLMHHFYYSYIVEPDRVWIYDRYYPSAYFMAATEYIMLFQQYKGSFQSPIEMNKRLTELDLLIIDDVFLDLMTDSKEITACVYDLFDMTVLGRTENKKFKLIYTSNKKADLISDMDNRMASRLRKKNVLVVPMDDYKKDWRDWQKYENI